MSAKLTEAEIKKRLERGRNYERLYRELKVKYEGQNLRIKELEEQNKQKDAIIETLMARIDQLETMVFGRGGGKSGNTLSNLYLLPPKPKKQKKNRHAASYLRAIPPPGSITREEYHDIYECHCGSQLTDFREEVRYVEDINLPILADDDQNGVSSPVKTVTRHIVKVGYCSRCGNYCSARDLRGATVTIGPNVRSLITYLIIKNDASYSQTIDLLLHCFNFKISSGEISNILESRGLDYLPEYNRILDTVRAGPIHMDETPLPIESEKGAGYAHVMVSAISNSNDTIFRLADSRGKGNSRALIGEGFNFVGVSDRLGNYKNLFEKGKHQICWAHLDRGARDITRLQSLPEEKRTYALKFYRQLTKIYRAIRKYQKQPFEQTERNKQATLLAEQIRRICKPHKLDCKKLTDLKAGILEYENCLFLCLTIDGVPADNNKAEQALRRLVIKRKKSFGVKTKRGAKTLEVLMSICQTFAARYDNECFVRMHQLALVEG